MRMRRVATAARGRCSPSAYSPRCSARAAASAASCDRSPSAPRCRSRATSPPTARRSSAATSCGPADQNKQGRAARPPRSSSTIISDASSADAGHHQLQQADRLRSRRVRPRSVQHAADGARVEGRRALRLRVRRGRRRRPVGVRQRPAQRLRRQRPGGAQPDRVRPAGSASLPASERPKTAAYPTSNDPFTAAAAAAGRRRSCRRPGVKTVYTKVFPAEVTDFTPIANQIAADQARRRGARLGRRADRLGVRPHLHPAALQPEVLHRDRRTRPGRRVREGGRQGQRERDLRARTAGTAARRRPTASRWSRSTSRKYGGTASDVNADVAEAYSVGQVVDRRPSRRRTGSTTRRSSPTCTAGSR